MNPNKLFDTKIIEKNGTVTTEVNQKDEKSHTYEEGGANPRISVWHLLINLKNNYLFKKLLKWANKKCKYFNIYKNFKKIIKLKKHLEISLFYTCVPTMFMI